jgi:glutamate racemase
LSHSSHNGSTPNSGTANPLTIGVRDSGVGGLTVAREIKKQIPRARLLYFADTAHVPYGDRAPGEVRYFALSITEFLIAQGAQIVVFACNTSSAYALQIAKKRFSIPLFGMIEPGARAALEANASTPAAPIGVLATSATIHSRMYARWIENLQSENSIKTQAIEIACPRFVPLVESEQVNTPAARAACEEYLQPVLQAGARTVILGCTHYPLLLPMLKKIAPQINFVDPAQFLAREIAALVASGVLPASNEADQFFVSGPRAGVESWIVKLLDNDAPQICAGPVFTPTPDKNYATIR